MAITIKNMAPTLAAGALAFACLTTSAEAQLMKGLLGPDVTRAVARLSPDAGEQG